MSILPADTLIDPIRSFERLVSQFMNQPLGPLPSVARLSSAMPVDVWRDGSAFHVEIDMPGVKEEDLDVSCDRGFVSVSAKRSAPYAMDGDQSLRILMNERAHGRFHRTFSLGESIDVGHIDASLADGVLHLRLPVAPENAGTHIPVRRELSSK